MKYILHYAFGFFLFMSLTRQGVQAQFRLSGRIVLNEGNAGAYANVLLLRTTDSTLARGTLADEQGRFEMNHIASGNYRLSASMIGYQPYRSELIRIEESGADVSLGEIVLQPHISTMDEVVIEAVKPLFVQQSDRLTINVENSVISAGSDALNILNSSPGVSINPQMGGISIAGKEGALVAINGKTQRIPVQAAIQMLQGIPATNIEKIELITHPDVSYDAEGNAGIINVLLKDNPEIGTQGNVSVNGGYFYGNDDRLAGVTQGNAGGVSASFTHRKNRLSLNGQYSYQRAEYEQFWDTERTRISTSRKVSTLSDRQIVTHVHNIRLGWDVEFNDRTSIGGILAGYSNEWDMNSKNERTIRTPTLPDSMNLMETDEINHWRHIMGNLNFRHQFSPSSSLSVDVDYLYYHDDNPYSYRLNPVTPGTNSSGIQEWEAAKETPIDILVGRMDYQHRLSKGLELSTGFKASLSEFTNEVSFNNFSQIEINPTGFESTRLDEDIWAGYINVSGSWDSLTQIALGLRYEHTLTLLDDLDGVNLLDRSYGNLLPNMSITRALTPGLTLGLSYNRRIARPTFNDMAPFVLFLDTDLLSTGNTALFPSTTDIVKLSTSFKGQTIGLEYARQTDAIVGFQPQQVEGTQQLLYRPDNLDLMETVTFSWNSLLKIAPFWTTQNSVLLLYQLIDSDHLGYQLEDDILSVQVSSYQRFQLPKEFAVEVSGNFFSSRFFNAFVMEPMGNLSMGVQKKWNQGSDAISLAVQDIFWLDRWVAERTFNPNDLDLFWAFAWDPTLFRITYTKALGKKSLKTKPVRQGGSIEERRRVN